VGWDQNKQQQDVATSAVAVRTKAISKRRIMSHARKGLAHGNSKVPGVSKIASVYGHCEFPSFQRRNNFFYQP